MWENFDKDALMQQLGGMKQGAPGMGAQLGARQPTSNTMPVREAPTATPLPAEAPPPPVDQPPMAAPLPAPPMGQPDDGGGVGALAGLLQQGRPPLPPPPTPQNIGGAIQGVGNALKPKNVLNALKPRNVGNALRNPLVALGGLFGRRR